MFRLMFCVSLVTHRFCYRCLIKRMKRLRTREKLRELPERLKQREKQHPRDSLKRMQLNLGRWKVPQVITQGMLLNQWSQIVQHHEIKQENSAGSDDEDYGAAIAKPAAPKKKPAKKASASTSDDDDDIGTLRDRLVAYNLGSSPDHTAMETETTKELQNEKKGRKEPNKRGAAKKALSSLTEIFDEEEDEPVPIHESEDEDFAVEEVQIEKKARGRKPATEKPKAITRKKAPAQGKAMRKKVTEEMFKPTEDSNSTAPSPEKKVLTEDTETSPSGSSAEPVAPAGRRPKMKCRT